MLLANIFSQRSTKEGALLVSANDAPVRFTIREFVLDDISRLQEIDVNVFYVHLRYTFGGPMGFLNAAIAHQKQKDRKDFYLAIVDNEASEVIGSVMIYDYKPGGHQAELGIVIDKPYQGHKIATEACAYAMLRFGGRLGLKNFYATVHPENVHSKKLLAKLGFIQAGDIFLSQYKGDPARPDSYDQEGRLVNAPRVGLLADYKYFLSRKDAIISELKEVPSANPFLAGDADLRRHDVRKFKQIR